jgi:hypothetical protein
MTLGNVRANGRLRDSLLFVIPADEKSPAKAGPSIGRV